VHRSELRKSEKSEGISDILGRSVAFLKTHCERKLGICISFIGIFLQAVRIAHRDLALVLNFGLSS
jgi:hypothetical protein